MHVKEKPLDKSPFELIGELLKKKREEIPDLNITFTNFSKWTPIRLQEAKNLLNRLAEFLPFFNEERTTIWAQSDLRSGSLESHSLMLELDEKIQDFRDGIESIQSINQQLKAILKTQDLSSLEALEKYDLALRYLKNIPSELPLNWADTNISEMHLALRKLKSDVQVIEQGSPYLLEMFSQELSELCNRFQNYSDLWLLRFFDHKYRADLELIKKLFNIKGSVSHGQLKHGLSQASKILDIKNKLYQPNYPAHQVFGSLFRPNVSREIELEPIEKVINWLTGLQQYLHLLPSNLVSSMARSAAERHRVLDLISKFESAYNTIKQGLEFLLSHFTVEDITKQHIYLDRVPFVELNDFLILLQDDLPNLQSWLEYKDICNQIDSLGTKRFLAALRTNNISSELWFPALEKLIYKTCLDSIVSRKPELRNFNFEVHERQIKEFARLDYSQLDVARERLKYFHAEQWQSFEKTSIAQSELLRLKKEVTRRRQHLPIRKLLNDKQKGIQNLAKTLKPCWMMSPLSVSQYIDPNVIHFDVLIFDEASQLRTEDVVSSIIRSDQVIVIGDTKQLPPTPFFSAGDNEEDVNDDNDASYESILDECSNFMFGRTLKWHYRSQDERLIAFSNLHFYDSQLVTFPNPTQNPDLGVWFKHVPNGVYDRGGRRDNQREAATVAQLVLKHVQQASNQSLGIIAFSEAQADAIQEQIEILGRDYPNLEVFCRDSSSQFFLKALENVQGDERDVILLSVGYARDSQDKLSLNFGPLNKQGGERRLNVAITRAKSKITLVSSILSGDIDLTRTQSEGVRLLRDYLEYAASGGERLQGNSYTVNLHFDSPFEEDVYHTIRQHSSLQEYTIRTQVGCSGYRIDLAIAHNSRPGEFLLGIECDGASYHSSSTARDRDRLRQQVLERLGWRIHRIWSTEWFRNKPEQIRLLVERINKLQ